MTPIVHPHQCRHDRASSAVKPVFQPVLRQGLYRGVVVVPSISYDVQVQNNV